MIGILFATFQEAAPFLERLGIPPKFACKEKTIAFTAHGMNGGIAISGMGRNAAATACMRLIRKDGAIRIINVGVSGALRDDHAVGDCFAIATVVDGEAFLTGDNHQTNAPHPRPTFSPAHSLLPWPGLAEARLATVDDGLFEAARRNRLAAVADLIDMEGYSVAMICAQHGVPCHLIKGVSDLAREGERNALRANLTPVSERLAGILFSGLTAFVAAPGGAIARINRLTRIEHTLFSLPLLFAGAWLGARGTPRLTELLWIIIAGLGARTFGMTVNRFLDRDLDARNPRTWNRELPAGAVASTQAILLAGAGLLAYLIAAAALGPLCLALAPLPILPLALYSLLKRRTALCHFGIGLCLAFAPLGAYVATANVLPFSPEILALALFTFLWISGFDIIYALQDIEADLRIGVRSLPAALGAHRATAIAALLHVGAIGTLAALWLASGGASGRDRGLHCQYPGLCRGLRATPSSPDPLLPHLSHRFDRGRARRASRTIAMNRDCFVCHPFVLSQALRKEVSTEDIRWCGRAWSTAAIDCKQTSAPVPHRLRLHRSAGLQTGVGGWIRSATL